MFNPRSPRSPRGSDVVNSSSTGSREAESLFTRKMPNDIYEDRFRTYSQLESFYMPYLKKLYEEKRSTVASLKSPEEFLFGSKLFEAREADIKKRLEITQKDNELKQQKIRELNAKVVHLLEKLKLYEPQAARELELPFNSFTEAEKDLKRLENLLKIKNEEHFFSLKAKATGLLEEFCVERSEIEGMNQVTTETGVFDFMLGKLKLKVK